VTPKSVQERMLDSMIDSARREPLPEIDVAMLEARLRRRWVGQSMKRPRRQLSWRWLSGPAVAVSVLAGGIAVQRQHAHTALDPARLSSTALNIDGNAWHVGRDIVAEDQPISVVHRNVARWVLAPHGRARIISQGPYLTVGLVMGRIGAEVVPSNRQESFAIETNSRRVAVHGTRFSVEHQFDGTVVDVLAGSVIVGSPGQPGQTTGTLMTAPQRLRFPLVEQKVSSPFGNAARAAQDTPPRKQRNTPSAPAAANSNSVDLGVHRLVDRLPERQSLIEQETALDVVRAAAARCFAQAKTNDSGRESSVIVRVETQLSVTLAPSGSVQDASFSPPVPDEITDCVRHEIADWSTSPSQLGSTASRAIMLTK
jgi:hypothetical protein